MTVTASPAHVRKNPGVAPRRQTVPLVKRAWLAAPDAAATLSIRSLMPCPALGFTGAAPPPLPDLSALRLVVPRCIAAARFHLLNYSLAVVPMFVGARMLLIDVF